MATISDFETLEEIARGAFATVWKARGRRGGDNTVFALKVCRPADWLEEGADSASAMAAFDEVVEDLRTLERHRVRYWVPVVANGATETEAFWVTRLYPRSLQTVLERRALLPPEDIHGIATAVARGLAELETHLQRPHGNLKASNIFIDGEGRLHELPVVLSDLKPRQQLSQLEDRIADFRELGRLIVLIVRRRPADARKPIGWPIEEGIEWKRFGRQGAAWRELCNRLLNPHPAPADLDWGKIGERLTELTPVRRRPWALAALIILPVAILAGGFCFLRFKSYESMPRPLQAWAARVGNVPKDVTIVPPEWAQLCKDYKEWLGNFEQVILNPNRTVPWPKDDYLNEQVLKGLRELGLGSFNPRKLAKENSQDPDLVGDLLTLASEPPDIVKKGKIAHEVRKVGLAVQAASRALEEWPERKKLDEARKRFSDLGWKGAAVELQTAVERSSTAALPGAAAKNVAAGIKNVIELSQQAKRAEGLWREVEQRGRALAGAGDPVMRGAMTYLGSRVIAASDLKALNGALAEAKQDAEAWLAAVELPGGQPRIDRARFAQESALRNFTGEITAAVLVQWKREVQEFQFLGENEDPWRKSDWAANLRKVDESLTQLRDEERTAPPGAAALPGLKQRRDEAERAVAGLRAKRLVRKDLAAAERDIKEAVGQIVGLYEAVIAAISQQRGNPVEWIGQVGKAMYGVAGSALGSEWVRRRDKFLEGLNPEALKRNNTEFRELRARQSKLEEFFKVLQGARGVAAFPKFETSGIAEELVSPLKEWARTRAERSVADWLQAVTWDGVVPASTGEAFVDSAAARGVVERLGADFREATELAADFSRISVQLVQGDDSAVATLAKWSKRPLLAELGATGPLRGLLEAEATLDKLGREERRDELEKAVGSPTLGIALAAWRRLGKLATWPTPAELDTELRLATDIAQRTEKAVPDPARREVLRTERVGELVRRWRVALRAAATDELMGKVLARRGDFGVNPSQLGADEKFNVELQRLKQIDWRGVSEDRVVEQRDEAVKNLRSPLGAQVPPAIETWLKLLLDLALTDKGGVLVDVRKLGPGAVGWSGELSTDSRQANYRRTLRGHEHQLGFILVDTDGAVPFYLGTTELSAGLLVDLADDAAVRTNLLKWLRAVADDAGDKEAVNDPRNGPRVWKLDRQRRIQLSGEWTGTAHPTWPKPLYAADIPDPSKPGRDVPVQYLPPSAAVYLAQDVLGCRLPALDEWQAVVASDLAKTSEDAKGPNFRDATWQKEREYLVKAGVADLPIDAEIFWPATVTSTKRGSQAQPATDRSDGVLWFATVATDQPGRLRHLFGNVAEYLFDETSKRFYVAGGSALSPPEVDPKKPYEIPLDQRHASGGYADVGVRLAFGAPGGVAGRARLHAQVRNQPFLRP